MAENNESPASSSASHNLNSETTNITQTTEGTATAAAAASLDDSDVITLNDVLQTEKQLYEDAYALLGAADDKNCTYLDGYLKRQALYACLTCIPEGKTDESKRAGVCLACCYHCHDGHELIELYTKRNFRCDCGNTKFERDCALYNEKDEINELNEYNQNFSGVYCVCHRPYPDPEDTIVDEMIQCVVCEDWYHCRHLGCEMPSENYAEMTCKYCVEKHEFLRCYDEFTVDFKKDQNGADSDAKVDIMSTSEEDPEALKDKNVNKDGEEGEGENKKLIINCKLPKEMPDNAATKFWSDIKWREQLCRCDSCMIMYTEHRVLFLLDLADTVQVYEEKGKAKLEENEKNQAENETKLLNSLDRVPLMETIAAYNDLRENLSDYLKKFAENKKVVREEDIREFFENMAEKKRQKTSEAAFMHA